MLKFNLESESFIDNHSIAIKELYNKVNVGEQFS